MIEANLERDRRELCRRLEAERRQRVSECVRAIADQRNAVRRANDRARLADNARIANWMMRFDHARANWRSSHAR